MGLKKNEKDESKAEEKKPEQQEEPEDPPVVKRLKEIDDKYLALEKEYKLEVEKLVKEYTAKQKPFLEERKVVLIEESADGPKTGTPALSGFWLKCMQNHPAFEDSIQEWDEPVLEFLQDIELIADESGNDKDFKLVFHFLENPYMENTKITKEYKAEESNPYSGEIEVKLIKSDAIEWKAGKDVTVEKIAKKAKGGKKQQKKPKEEARPSFFREFFRDLSPDMKLPEDLKEQAMSMADEDEEMEDDEELIQYIMDNDHDIGTALRDQIIPFAIRWYTGEAAPEYLAEDDDDEDEEEEEEDESESDDEPPVRGRGGKAKAAPKKAGKKGSPELKPAEGPKEECKQQ